MQNCTSLKSWFSKMILLIFQLDVHFMERWFQSSDNEHNEIKINVYKILQ